MPRETIQEPSTQAIATEALSVEAVAWLGIYVSLLRGSTPYGQLGSRWLRPINYFALVWFDFHSFQPDGHAAWLLQVVSTHTA